MQTSLTIFMALLLAHLLGDFPLQSKWISRHKGTSLRAMVLHGVAHYLLSWACLILFTQVRWLSVSTQGIILGFTVIHLLTDKLKYWSTTQEISLVQRSPFVFGSRKTLMPDDWKTFLLDQSLHVIFLAAAASILNPGHLGELMEGLQPSPIAKQHILEVAMVYIAVVFGGGYLIRYLTKGLAKDAPSNSPAQLENAGLYIGWLERLLVVTAIAVQTPALVGLILTGKSIARFPEFKEPRFVEYFLIGTLLSISIAVLGGIVLHQLLYGTISLK
jgi:uncharacterized membrane protein